MQGTMKPSTPNQIIGAVLDMLYPPRCAGCDSTDDSRVAPLCQNCDSRLVEMIEQHFCTVCGRTVDTGAAEDDLRCAACRKRRPKLAALARVGAYEGLLREWIPRYKYGNRSEFGPILVERLSERVRAAPWYSRVEAVTTVPTHWTLRVRRPFHAADELGRLAARSLGLPYVQLLARTRGGKRQVGLSFTQRVQNVRGLYRVRPSAKLEQARLLLVDDVRTTGATLAECAKVLREAGAAEVFGAVVACADVDDPTA